MNAPTFILPGSVRIKKNSKDIIIVNGRHMLIPTAAYKRWEAQARHYFWISSRRGFQIYSTPVHVKATFYFKGPKPDIHGCMESLADCMQGFAWTNDGLIASWDGTRMIHDKINPRTEFTVRPMGDEQQSKY